MQKMLKHRQATPPWYLALGPSLPDLTGQTWRDGPLAIAHTQPTASARFIVVGDLWLSNRSQILHRLGLSPTVDHPDLQLVAQLWEKHGVASLAHLQGMFALAIWDRVQQTLWLVRDRVGAYTLYYTASGSTRWVAPRLRTLAPWRSNQLDAIALRDYLCCAFVPGERTLWQDLRELRPGTYLQIPDGEPQTYWQPQEQIIHADKPLTWHAQALRSRLEDAVKAYLPPGRPVGAYLSGGVDSSCITALAAQFHDQPVHTYSIHFGADYPHELAFSQAVAHHCQTQHHVLEITPKQMWQQLPETLAALDDPIGDPLTVPNLLLGRAAQRDVSVILNGEGGDPCFGGPKNKPMLLRTLYNPEEAHSDRVTAYLNSFKKCGPDLPHLMRPAIWQMVRHQPSLFAADLQSSAAFLNRLMGLNIKFKGADHILTKVNNLTRTAGVQGRSPLFDASIVELSLQIPPAYKLAGATEKAVLKAAVADLLPESVVTRPKKGMMVPVQAWFRRPWNRRARSLLLRRNAAIAPYLNQSLIRDWLAYRGDLWRRYGAKLWLLVSLEVWLQVNLGDR